jgi:hypothetical protein
MRTLVMGRVMVILIGWLFRRERVHGMTPQLVKCGFDVFDVFDVGTLVLEELNNEIERSNVFIDILDACLVL